MFYGKRAKRRLHIVKGLYLLSCFLMVYTAILVLTGFAIAFN